MNQKMGFNRALLFTTYKFMLHQIIMLFYFDSKKNNSNFTSFKSTEINHKMYGECSSTGQSTWLWSRRLWVQVPSLTQDLSGYSVVRLTRLLWEQEIGSSNLSTPTLEKPQFSVKKPHQTVGLLIYHILSIKVKYTQLRDTFLRDTQIYGKGRNCFFIND